MPSHRTGSGWDQRNMRERACTAPALHGRDRVVHRAAYHWFHCLSPPKQGSTAQHSTSALLHSSQCPVVLAEAGSIPTQLKLRDMRCGQDSGRASVRVPVVNEDFILLVRTVRPMISHVLWSYHSLHFTMVSFFSSTCSGLIAGTCFYTAT